MDNTTLLGEWFTNTIFSQYLPETWMQIAAGIVLLVVLYRLTSWLASYGFSGLARRTLKASGKEHWLPPLKKHKVTHYISNALPLFVIAGNIGLLPISAELSDLLSRVLAVIALIYLVLAITGAMASLQEIFASSSRGRTRSIKGYVEVARIALWALAIIVMISLMFNRSPFLMLSGLGAISAVL
ncbi:MAG TPA: mechanosensitive ion channel family protein, partial [Paenalcaligenes sp.]|nr:mechanosensitive ion channel family protein [Paenalcaligenes sp.]